MKFNTMMGIFLGIFIVLTPLGLISEYPAWGEWSHNEFLSFVGYVPMGILHGEVIEALIPDYSIEGVNDIMSTFISAFLGVIGCFGFFALLKRISVKRHSS